MAKKLKWIRGYDYLKNFNNDYTKLAQHFVAIGKIGKNLILNYKFDKNIIDENLFELNCELSFLSSFMSSKIEIFCNRWDECFNETYGIKCNNNNNPFCFVNKLFNIEKHLEREVNDFYHGWYSPMENIGKEDKNKIIKLISNLENQNIYDFMKNLNEKDLVFRKSYINHCKKEGLGNGKGPLKDFGDVTYKEFVSLTNEFLPLFKSYLNIFININANKKMLNEKDIIEICCKNLKSTKFCKKIWKMFIVKEWRKYIKRLEKLMHFFVFFINNLGKNKFNDKEYFLKTNFANKTDWWNQFLDQEDMIIKKYWNKHTCKIKLVKLDRI